MSGLHSVPPPTCTALPLNTVVAHFEEEKTFFGSMFVIVTPHTRRRLRKESRSQRRRNRSSLGRVVRRSEAAGVAARQTGHATEEELC